MGDFDVEREADLFCNRHGLSPARFFTQARADWAKRFTCCHDAAVKEREALWLEYVDALDDELDELVGLATTHGWQSHRIDEGKRLRGLLGIAPHDERRRKREELDGG